LVITTRNSTVRPQLTQRERKIANRICRDGKSFPNDRDSSRPATGGYRMSVGELRIFHNQFRGHHQVPGDLVSVFFAQRLELSARNTIQLVRKHINRDLRRIVASSN
jgi:hypothetical protein